MKTFQCLDKSNFCRMKGNRSLTGVSSRRTRDKGTRKWNQRGCRRDVAVEEAQQ